MIPLQEVSRSARRLRAAVLFGVTTAALAPSAFASRVFPPALQAAVPMPCTPTCDVCHLTAAGGPGNVRAGGFADTLRRSHELMLGQEGTVKPAIESARTANIDTDADGVPDVAELMEGGNPNSSDPNANFCESPGPQYGCGAGRIAAGDSIDGLAAFLAGATLAVGASLLRRRARRN